MKLFSSHKLLLAIAALLLVCVPSVQAQNCARLNYYGSPINFIHRAHEHLHGILQYTNVDTKAFFLGSNKTFDLATNTISEDLLYFITDTPALQTRKLIALKVSSKNQKTFVDEYAMLDLRTATVLSYTHILTKRFQLQKVLPNILNYQNAFDCRLIKEEFTFFYDMYPSRNQKIIS
jgi:hypothetical protein